MQQFNINCQVTELVDFANYEQIQLHNCIARHSCFQNRICESPILTKIEGEKAMYPAGFESKTSWLGGVYSTTEPQLLLKQPECVEKKDVDQNLKEVFFAENWPADDLDEHD